MSSTVPENMTVEVLRTSLAANNMPIWGSREVMWTRLISGAERKKPGPKPGSKNATSSKTSKPMFDAAELKFYAEERPRLAAQGITDTTAQNAELKRRYALTKKPSATATPTATATSATSTMKLPTLLDAAQLSTMGLKLISVEPTDNGQISYVYQKVAGSGTAPNVLKKRKTREEEEEEGSEEDEEMSECEDIVTMRLVKRGDKEWLSKGCELYGVPVSGSKKVLAERLAEQLCNETDDEAEE